MRRQLVHSGGAANRALHAGGGILQRTPRSPRAMVQHGCGVSQVLTELLRRAQARPRRQNVAQIIGQPFIHPQQVAMHWLLIVGRGQSRRAAILAVPGMDKLMRQKVGFQVV